MKVTAIAIAYVAEFGKGAPAMEWARDAYATRYSGPLDFDRFYLRLNLLTDPAALRQPPRPSVKPTRKQQRLEVASEEAVGRELLGTGRIAGAFVPIENVLYRCTTPKGTVSWKVVYGLCNGSAGSSRTYRKKSAALSALTGAG